MMRVLSVIILGFLLCGGFYSSIQAQKRTFVPGEIIVKFKTDTHLGTSLSSQSGRRSLAKSFSLPRTPLSIQSLSRPTSLSKTRFQQNQSYLMQFDRETNLQEMLDTLKDHPNIEYAQPNYIYQAFSLPNDPGITSQNNLNTLELPDAWEISTSNSNVIIAVIDSGVDWEHQDLENIIWVNEDEEVNGADTDNNGYIDDIRGWDFVDKLPNLGDELIGEDYKFEDNDPGETSEYGGHGTHVAGIAAAESNNGIGISGVSWGATIMPIRAGAYQKYVDPDDGKTKIGALFNSDTLAKSIDYAADNGANIINLSLGGPTDASDYEFENAIARAQAKGVLVVAAAGNESVDIDKANVVPAIYKGVLTVSSVNNSGFPSYFSNYGSSVDVAAPGESIFSTLSSNTYGTYDGTSMSAPHVAGLAALILSYDPSLDGKDLFEVIRRSAKSSKNGHSPRLGYGVANARQALGILSPELLTKENDPLLFGTEGLLGPVLNSPNPFNPEKEVTRISYNLTKPANVTISIYTLRMRVVKTLREYKPAGYHRDAWDGRDESQDIVPNGVYVMQIKVNGDNETVTKQHKIVVLR